MMKKNHKLEKEYTAKKKDYRATMKTRNDRLAHMHKLEDFCSSRIIGFLIPVKRFFFGAFRHGNNRLELLKKSCHISQHE
jgi:hypothetical protein